MVDSSFVNTGISSFIFRISIFHEEFCHKLVVTRQGGSLVNIVILLVNRWRKGHSICIRNSLFSNDAKVNNVNRIDFEKLLRATLRNNFFNFKGKIYKKIDGVAMGTPLLSPTLANAFLCFHEQI